MVARAVPGACFFLCAIFAACALLGVKAQPYADMYEHPDPNAPPEPIHIRELFHGEDASEDVNLAFAVACEYGDMEAVEKALTDGHELHLNDVGFASFNVHKTTRIWYHREWVFKHGNDRGETALHRAVLGNHDEVAKRLVEAGWDVNAEDENNHTPLDYAHQKHHEDLAIFLEERGAIAEHHRINIKKYRKHREHHVARMRQEHDRYHHRHEHAEVGGHSSNHWVKNHEYHDL
jgi:hypothetical protein